MSAAIRPLPQEAAPQRTESDAGISSNQEASPFGEILDLHLEDEDQRQEPSKTGAPDVAPWTFFGVAPAVPVLTPVLTPASPGPSAPASVHDDDGGNITELMPALTAASETLEGPGLETALSPASVSEEQEQISPPASGNAEEIAGENPEGTKNTGGMTDAKQPAMLLMMEKQDRSSSFEQQRFLEASEEASVTEQVPLPARAFVRAAERPLQLPVEKVSVPDDMFFPAVRVEPPVALGETLPVSEVRPAAILEAVRDHVELLKVSRQNELHVVLRPDAHTELSLQIRHVDGQIHLQARCERGDFAWLDSQWSAVQHALGNQGVRVEPLQSPGRMADSTGSMLMQDHSGSHRESKQPMFSTEQEKSQPFKPSSRPTGSAPRTRGWQSWA